MDINRYQSISRLFKERGIRPNKLLGQNFLVSEKDLTDIVDLAEIKPGETVLEVGAGVGNLTRELLKRGARVIAVEKDKELAAILKRELKQHSNILQNVGMLLHVKDILRFDERVVRRPYKLVGNIPYYLTAPLVRKFLTSSNPPKRIVLTIQKEVGERITAKPPHSTFLSNMVALYGRAEIKKRIPSSHFWPQPKVDSVVIVIKPKIERNLDRESLVSFIKQGFRQPRKTLVNNLVAHSDVDKSEIERRISELGLDPKTRPQELTTDQWQKLHRAMNLSKE